MRIGNRPLAIVFVIVGSAGLAPPRWAAAQLPAAPSQAAPAQATSSKSAADTEKAARGRQAVEAVEPEIMYVPDKKGGREQIPLLNLTLEEIHELMALKDGTFTAKRPGFRLKELTATATAGTDQAKLAAELTVELTIDGSDPEWVRVPLRLGNIVLVERAEFAGEGEHLLEFDADSREYVAWLRGATSQPRKLRLTAWAPLEHEAGETRLRLNMPRATYSNLRLSVPLANAAGRVISGGILAESKASEGKTEFRATGLTGDFVLAWQPATERRAEASTILSVDGQIVASIDSRGIRTAATLRVNAFGRDFSSFRVRLPRGATLVPMEQPNYTVTEVAGEQPIGDQKTGPADDQPAGGVETGHKQAGGKRAGDRPPRVVEVRLKAKSAGQEQRIQLVTEQAHDVAQGGGGFELGGFEVIDAVRQYGYLAVQVKDDWQVIFGDLQGVQQSDDLPPEMPRDNVIAGFVYYGQPYSLPARIAPRQTRTSVDAHYVVAVAPRQLRLDATLKYHVAGAKVFSVEIDLGDWRPNLASLARNALIDGPRIDFGPGNLLRIPLKQAVTGELELKLEAQQETAAAESVEFGLPRPLADTVSPADLVVMPDDRVRLAPRELKGLTSNPAEGGSVSPGRQPIWSYRTEAPDARFVGDVQVAVRQVTASVKSKVTLVPDGAQVEQWLDYDIENEAADSLAVDVPRALASSDLLEARIGESRLKFEAAGASDVQDGPVVHRRLALPAPCLGPCQLTISYRWRDAETASPPPLTTVPLEVPLVMPGDARCVSNELTVVSRPSVRVVPADKQWSVEPAAAGGLSDGLVLTASEPKRFVALGLENQQNETLVIDRAWLRTTLSAHARQDRVVYRFMAPATQVTMRLPPGSSHERFWLDGRELTGGAEDRPGERTIALPAGDGWHVLESTYDVALTEPPRGRQSYALAELIGATSIRQAYWQLVLPPGKYLMTGPADWTPEFAWQRHGVVWLREPLLDPAEISGWADARGTGLPAPSSASQYLFSSLEPRGAIEVRIVGRSLLVLTASGAVLVLGLLWLYVPKLRHPAWLFVAGLAVLTAAALWPDAAPLATQAALVGGVLAAMAVVLERNIARWHRAPASFRPSPSSIVSRGSAHPPLAVPPGPASTRSAVPLELSAPESRS